MKPKPETDELRMKSGDFDRIMRGVLAVAPPVAEKKPRARKKPASKRKAGK